MEHTAHDLNIPQAYDWHAECAECFQTCINIWCPIAICKNAFSHFWNTYAQQYLSKRSG